VHGNSRISLISDRDYHELNYCLFHLISLSSFLTNNLAERNPQCCCRKGKRATRNKEKMQGKRPALRNLRRKRASASSCRDDSANKRIYFQPTEFQPTDQFSLLNEIFITLIASRMKEREIRFERSWHLHNWEKRLSPRVYFSPRRQDSIIIRRRRPRLIDFSLHADYINETIAARSASTQSSADDSIARSYTPTTLFIGRFAPRSESVYLRPQPHTPVAISVPPIARHAIKWISFSRRM